MNQNNNIEFPMRLARFMALAGTASRRESEKIISAGRVKVNGAVINVPGTKVGQSDIVEVDGNSIALGKRHYIMLNKPTGYTCTAGDPYADKIVFDLIDIQGARLFTAGRLDRDSEGLIIITNDGDYAAKLTHPRYQISKNYMVETDHPIPEEKLEELRRGIVDEGEKLIPQKVIHETGNCYRFVLNEGKNREIRRMVKYCGRRTITLKRVSIGTLKLGKLPSGKWRNLTNEEIKLSLL